ncbi:hypothetical protein ACFLUT_02010 [Chloroflexota bacterium]
MKKTLPFLAVLLVLLLPGCSYFLPETNQPPKAYIDNIAPSDPSVGDTVSFSGHGTDADGNIVAYRWRSSTDGELSSAQSFQTADLSAGEHTIYLKVQDNNDSWSPEVRRTIMVLAGPQLPAKVNKFEADPETIADGEESTLSWQVSNSTNVSINQGIGVVTALGTVDVSPAETTTYTLTAKGGGTTATAQVTVEVEEPALDIVFFEADSDSVPSGEVVTLSWKTTGATKVRILPLIGVVDPVGSVEVTYTFTLIAEDDEDTITEEVEVQSYLLMPDSFTKELEVVLSKSGYVRDTNVEWDEYIYVGDDTNDIGIQAFITFDMSELPEDAMITSVDVDFSDHDTTYGDPFGDLGCLRAYIDDFGTLDGGDYHTGRTSGTLSTWCDIAELETVDDDDDYVDALEDRLGDHYFQIRLQFRDEETDGDGNNDMVRWTSSHLPVLIVDYYSYDED